MKSLGGIYLFSFLGSSFILSLQKLQADPAVIFYWKPEVLFAILKPRAVSSPFLKPKRECHLVLTNGEVQSKLYIFIFHLPKTGKKNKNIRIKFYGTLSRKHDRLAI